MSSKGRIPSKLISAIRAGCLDDVIEAVHDGADIEEADIHGFRGLPLRTACFEGDMTIVRELLQRGASVNALAVDGAAAPLRLALRCGHRDLAALLLARGSEVPPGLDVEASILEQAAALDAAPDEAQAPRLPESAPDNIIEFNLEPGEPFAADTSIPFRFSHDPSQSATTSQPGFWTSSRTR